MRKLLALVGMAIVAVLAMSSSAAAHGTTCNSTQTGATITDDLVVPANESCTIINSTVGDDVQVGKNAFFQATGSQIGGHVEGNRSLTIFIDTGTTVGDGVEANRTTQLFVFNSTITGTVEAWRATDKVHICGNQVDGDVHVHRSGPDILVGDPLTVGCSGNTVKNGHSVDVEDNYTDNELVVRGNTIQGGDLKVLDNSGPSDKFVQDNKGGDELVCFGNESPFTSSGNTGWSEQKGQCAVPPDTCNSPNTLTGQTFAGDVVVPDDGSCTLAGSTVGGKVKVGKNAYFQATGTTIGGDVSGKRSQTIFIDTGSTVGGDVNANRTAQVFLFNATLKDVNVWRSTDKVHICGNQIDGDVSVGHSGPDILVGDPLTVGCSGNTVKNGHSVDVEDNYTDNELVVRGNTIQGGDLKVLDNSGPSDKFVQDNKGGDELVCFGNESPFTSSGNTGWSEQKGQCAVPPDTCNSPNTLTGQTFAGDVVVPDDGSCTLAGSTVGGKVKVGKNAYFQATGTTIGGDVSGKRSQTIFIDTGSTVGGDVNANRTAQVFLFNATLKDVNVWRSTDKVHICGNQIDGDVSVGHSGPDILVGDPLTVGCSGNTVKNGHSVDVEDNYTDNELVVRGNTIQGGDLKVLDNSGPSDKFVQDNTGGNRLVCEDNDPTFTGTTNGFTSEEGQCSEL